MPFRSKRASERQSFHLALTLPHVDGDVRLSLDARREMLRRRGRYGRVAMDDLHHAAAQRLYAQRQWRDIEQQHVLGRFRPTCEDVRLHGGAEGDYFIRIQLRMRFSLEQILHDRPHARNAR